MNKELKKITEDIIKEANSLKELAVLERILTRKIIVAEVEKAFILGEKSGAENMFNKMKNKND